MAAVDISTIIDFIAEIAGITLITDTGSVCTTAVYPAVNAGARIDDRRDLTILSGIDAGAKAIHVDTGAIITAIDIRTKIDFITTVAGIALITDANPIGTAAMGPTVNAFTSRISRRSLFCCLLGERDEVGIAAAAGTG